jgi:hypothetical protein
MTENEAAGRELRATMDLPGGALVAVLGPGGAELAGGLTAPEEPDPYVLDGFGAVARLAGGDPPVVLIADDGTASPEEVAAAAWSLMALRPVRMLVAAPTASRYLEALLPPRCEVHALRRYVPVPPGTAPPPGSARPARRRPLPERAGRPWSTEEEDRLTALVRDRTSLTEIAATLGRTRGAISRRIAELAVRDGSLGGERSPEGALPGSA